MTVTHSASDAKGSFWDGIRPPVITLPPGTAEGAWSGRTRSPGRRSPSGLPAEQWDENAAGAQEALLGGPDEANQAVTMYDQEGPDKAPVRLPPGWAEGAYSARVRTPGRRSPSGPAEGDTDDFEAQQESMRPGKRGRKRL